MQHEQLYREFAHWVTGNEDCLTMPFGDLLRDQELIEAGAAFRSGQFPYDHVYMTKTRRLVTDYDRTQAGTLLRYLQQAPGISVQALYGFITRGEVPFDGTGWGPGGQDQLFAAGRYSPEQGEGAAYVAVDGAKVRSAFHAGRTCADIRQAVNAGEFDAPLDVTYRYRCARAAAKRGLVFREKDWTVVDGQPVALV